MPDPMAGLPPRFCARQRLRDIWAFPAAPLKSTARTAQDRSIERSAVASSTGWMIEGSADLRAKTSTSIPARARYCPPRNIRPCAHMRARNAASCPEEQWRCGANTCPSATSLNSFSRLPGNLAPRDAQDLMAYPFFSSAKTNQKSSGFLLTVRGIRSTGHNHQQPSASSAPSRCQWRRRYAVAIGLQPSNRNISQAWSVS